MDVQKKKGSFHALARFFAYNPSIRFISVRLHPMGLSRIPFKLCAFSAAVLACASLLRPSEVSAQETLTDPNVSSITARPRARAPLNSLMTPQAALVAEPSAVSGGADSKKEPPQKSSEKANEISAKSSEAVEKSAPSAAASAGSEKSLVQASEEKPQAAAEEIEKIISEAELYLYGDGVTSDLKKAAGLYEKAAGLGSPKAMMRLAALYRNGQGVEKSLSKSVELIKEAASKNFVPAEAALGFAYLEGTGVAKNEAEAALWLEKAASGGHVLARVMTAERYLQSADEHERKKGESFLDSVKIYCSPSELYTVSSAFARGMRLPKDPEKALFWAKAAAEKGSVNAMYSVGEYYWGKNENAEALSWFIKAAEKGLPAAELQVGRIYRDGAPGVEKDAKKAVFWLEKALPGEHAEDLILLTKLFLTGPSTVRDEKKAQKFFESYIGAASAKDLNVEADRYWEGKGVRKNFDLGGALALAALKKGDRSEVCSFALKLSKPNWEKADPVTAYALLSGCLADSAGKENPKLQSALSALEERLSTKDLKAAQALDPAEALNNYLQSHKPSVY